jgi:streptogramin lyase
MMRTNAFRFLVMAALFAGSVDAVSATEIQIADAGSQPESMTVGPHGELIVGSASSPFIYRMKAAAASVEKFVDASSEPAGTFFFGMLADAATKTLWACQLTPVAGSSPVRRQTALRGFDLETGAPKLRWNLPGENSTCNDFAIGPDKALYVTDTANAKIYRLASGTQVPELWFENRALMGVDGITFLDGVMYVNNVFFSKLYRIPVDAAGKPSAPVDIWMDAPVRGPDGMRAARGKLFVAENANGKISMLTVDGDRAHVTVIREGLKTPTGVEPVGDVLWFTERGTGKVFSVPLPK